MSADANPFMNESIAEAVFSVFTLYTNLIFLRHSFQDIFSIPFTIYTEQERFNLPLPKKYHSTVPIFSNLVYLTKGGSFYEHEIEKGS